MNPLLLFFVVPVLKGGRSKNTPLTMVKTRCCSRFGMEPNKITESFKTIVNYLR